MSESSKISTESSYTNESLEDCQFFVKMVRTLLPPHIIESNPYSLEEARNILKNEFSIKPNRLKVWIFNFGRKNYDIHHFRGLMQVVLYLYRSSAFHEMGISRLNGSLKNVEKIQGFIRRQEIFEYSKFTPYELVNGIKAFVFNDLNGMLNYEAAQAIINSKLDEVILQKEKFLRCFLAISTTCDAYYSIIFFKTLGFMAKNEKFTKMNSKPLSVLYVPVVVGSTRMKKISVEKIGELILKLENFIDIFV